MDSAMTRLHRDIDLAYGDPIRPNYGFVTKRLESKMHEELVASLGEKYQVTETTDVNDDVSRALVLKDANTEIGLRLSLVGLYAAISDREGRLLESWVAETDPSVRDLARGLRQEGYHILWRAELQQEMRFGEEGARALYEVLFSSDEAILI